MEYVIKLKNEYYVQYEQTDDLVLEVDHTTIKYADTFTTYESAKEFALAINNRRDGDYTILSYEDAMSVVGVDEDYNIISEKLVNNDFDRFETYIVNVTKDSYAGQINWVEECCLEGENGEDIEDIFSKYKGKKIKLTIEVVE